METETRKGRPPAKWADGKRITHISMRADADLWHEFKVVCLKNKISASEQMDILISRFTITERNVQILTKNIPKGRKNVKRE